MWPCLKGATKFNSIKGRHIISDRCMKATHLIAKQGDRHPEEEVAHRPCMEARFSIAIKALKLTLFLPTICTNNIVKSFRPGRGKGNEEKLPFRHPTMGP